MKQWRLGGDLARQFHTYMSRRNPLALLGDLIGNLVLSSPMQAALAGPQPALKKFPVAGLPTVYMAIGPGATSSGRPAPTTPALPNRDAVVTGSTDSRPGFWDWVFHPIDHAAHKQAWDAAHSVHGCADPRYHGMHGRPCKFEGGSDTKCPAGTVSGWFWTYDVPGLGTVYYVDCCGGGTPTDSVWCNWSQEQNWCLGIGRAANQTPAVTKYFCTLSILDRDMRTTAVGGGLEVVGVDP